MFLNFDHSHVIDKNSSNFKGHYQEKIEQLIRGKFGSGAG